MDPDIGDDELALIVHEISNACVLYFAFILLHLLQQRRRSTVRSSMLCKRSYGLVEKVPKQIEHLHDVVYIDPTACIDYLRMSSNAFGNLCILLEQFGGLTTNRNVSVPEQVAMFLVIIAHHEKNRIVRREYRRSGHTISKYFHRVLNSIIRVHEILLAQPEPVSEDCTDERWSAFKGCLGALDGTYIPIRVSHVDRPRYRNRKGEVSVNVLGVCNRQMNFVYVLTGWEGSAADSRVLRDAMTRPNGLKVPQGCYYLCNNGYMNCPGFLTPYRGTRYHLDAWGHGRTAPQNPEEYFNMKHCKVRNVIEHAFGLLKMRWAILRSPSFYPPRVHNRIIMACCLLHNYIRMTMPNDPLENQLQNVEILGIEDPETYLQSVEANPQWTAWRDNLASSLYNDWRENV